MCGIVGFLDKQGAEERDIGQTLLNMLQALACRGPDSAGVALFGPPRSTWILQIKLPEPSREAKSRATPDELILGILRGCTSVLQHETIGAYFRVEILPNLPATELEERLLEQAPGAELVSLGHRLEIIKQVGSPAQLEKSYGISLKNGSHGIGHTRLSTESRVDLSHSQPFWAHGVPDLATVHNGHVTNYHKLRRKYEQKGYRFFTENDSEVIGVYLRDRMATGLSFADALRSSLDDLDGSFCYLAATENCLAYVKDRFGFKPLVVAKTDEFVAIATEEIALQQALRRDFVTVATEEIGLPPPPNRQFVAREASPGTVGIWSVESPQDAHL